MTSLWEPWGRVPYGRRFHRLVDVPGGWRVLCSGRVVPGTVAVDVIRGRRPDGSRAERRCSACDKIHPPRL